MDRRRFLGLCAAGIILAAPACAAEDYVARIVGQLTAQGYDQITVSRTLLGRMRITAAGRRGSREIIVNPATGEILRDLQTGGSDTILGEDGRGRGEGGKTGSGSGKGDDDDDDDDDDDGDDDDGDDNSGEGGGGGDGGDGDDD